MVTTQSPKSQNPNSFKICIFSDFWNLDSESGFWIRILNSGFWIFRILNLDSEFEILIRILNPDSESGFWILDSDSESGFWIRIQNPYSGFQILNPDFRILEFGFRFGILDSESGFRIRIQNPDWESKSGIRIQNPIKIDKKFIKYNLKFTIKIWFNFDNYFPTESNLTVSTLLNLPDRTRSLLTGVGELFWNYGLKWIIELWWLGVFHFVS